ncbi:MAG: PorP/SprF family type IX secretion system membrane protein [Saprospiraceae bacterium]|nr:PorP/SprF family type IX secretion system membrane protein [Saprospiraceae bacterium]
MYPPILLTFLGLFICFAPAVAQDLHFSQFYHNPTHLTPAATGVFKGEWRVAGLYRSQWRTVPVSYETYSISADWKAIQQGKSLISFGILLQNDQAGDANLSWGQGGLNLSAAHSLGKLSSISIGFGLAAIQRSVDITRLKFKNQWATDFFDPNLPSKEPFGSSSGLAATLSAGLLWHYQSAESRNRASVGFGAFHLNRPVVSLGGIEETKLPVRIPFFSEAVYQIRESTDLVAFAAAQSMKSAKEMVIGAGMRQILTTGLANITSIQATLATRLGDAIIPAVQMERNNWLVGISYDLNISRFDEATDSRGGIEIAVVWRVVPVPVTKVVKCCPVF